MEGTMRRRWDRVIEALVFVRLGQQLGSDSELAQSIAGVIDAVLGLLSRVDLARILPT